MSGQQVFKFSVDSALLRELGEKLVSTVHVALAELVKNSYDADANKVLVSIETQDGLGPRIVIEDNGSGMTPEDVASFWMRIGTVNKEDNPVSKKFGRLRTGRKGVGRFACRRLGRLLQLETIAVDPKAPGKRTIMTKVSFDWDQFEPGTTVESVECEGVTTTFNEDRPTGTRLVISGAEVDEWQDRGYDYVRRQLAVMASNTGTKRGDFEEDMGFAVHFNDPTGAEKQEDLRETVIEASWGTLSAYVQDDGRAVFTLSALGLPGKRKFTTSPEFGPLVGASLRLGILPVHKSEGVRDRKLLANYVLRQLIDEWGGVQVRFNGFRMYPYGNPGDDWLEIDADRGRRLGKPGSDELFSFATSQEDVDPYRVLLTMLGMRNYLGHVDVTSEISGLEPRLDRQGFIESRIFELLRKFVRNAIEWATIQRDAYIRKRNQVEAREALENIIPILESPKPSQFEQDATPRATEFLRQQISRIVTALPAAEQAETKQTLFRTVKALEAISADAHSQLRHLRLVAAASTLTLLFAHEVRSSISSLGAGSARLRTLAKQIPSHRDELNGLSQQFGATQTHLARLVDMTGIVGAFRSDQRTVDVNVKSAVEKAVGCFRLVIENYRIHVDMLKVSLSLQVGPIIEGEIYTILINLISNAIKSLIAHGQPDKTIRIWTETISNKAVIKIADNGTGLDPDHFDDVFTPFISDPSGMLYDKLEENANPEDSAIFGTGSGLGLSIARDISRARGGDIRFVSPDQGWAACVEVELP